MRRFLAERSKSAEKGQEAKREPGRGQGYTNGGAPKNGYQPNNPSAARLGMAGDVQQGDVGKRGVDSIGRKPTGERQETAG